MRSIIVIGAAALAASSSAPAGMDFAAVQSAPAPVFTGPAMGVSYQDDVYDRKAASREAVAAAAPGASDEEKRDIDKRTYCNCGSSHPSKPYKPHPAKPAPPPHGEHSHHAGGEHPHPPPGGEHPPPPPPGGEHPHPPPGGEHPPPPPSGGEHPHPPPGGEHPHPPPGGEHPSARTTCTTSRGGASTMVTVSTSSVASVTTSELAVTSSASHSHEVPSSCTPVSWTNTFAFTTDTACPTPYEVGTYCGFINPEDPCAVQPDGFGPVSSPDTVDAFRANEELHMMATSASTPKGYKNTFTDLSAAVNANSYLGYTTLESYDVQGCADLCDNKELCTAFNIYIERDPKWNPEQCSCNVPDSITNFKCSLWGSGVESGAAVNVGEGRGDFEVAIIGSNGYAKTEETEPATPDGCNKPTKCPAVHHHPSSCVSEHFFPGPFDVSVCAKFAQAHNLYSQHSKRTWGTGQSLCSFFNAFMVLENEIAQGTYCKLFTEEFGAHQATWTPGHSQSSEFSIESSWSFCLDN